jgi:hypothetical protein
MHKKARLHEAGFSHVRWLTSLPEPMKRLPSQLLLLLILLVAVLLRIQVALRAPWYWDEGYVVELAQSLAQGGRPQVGALWHDGFFPLSTSWLAPWSAVPFLHLPGGPMLGVRVWAVLWEAVCVLLLFLVGRRWASERVGLVAAALYAVLPFAMEHGGRAFYHHLASAFLLLGILLGQRAWEEGRPRTVVAAGLAQGLAVATCYWLWWLPLTWLLGLAWRQRRWLVLGCLVSAILPLSVLAVNFLPDPAGARWSMQSLLQTAQAGAPQGLLALLRALAGDLKVLSFLILGLAGLLWAAWREPRRWAWPALVLALAILEPARQRGLIVGMPYPFQLAAPLAALGLALPITALRERAQAWSWGLAVLLGLAWLRPHPVATMQAWSVEPSRVAELQAFFATRLQSGGLVCGLPSFNWALKPEMEVCEPFEVGAYEGRASGFYAPGAPGSRFVRPCGLDQVRYAVMTRQHFLGAVRFEGVALSFLEMERELWPLVFDSPAFKVYENPLFGSRVDLHADLLRDAENYVIAAGQAERAGRPDAERYALSRAQTLGWKP